VAVIIGEQEHQNNEVSIKWLRADLIENDIQQETIPANRLVDAIKQKV
jgi:histidyl-tRNA synthetase